MPCVQFASTLVESQKGGTLMHLKKHSILRSFAVVALGGTLLASGMAIAQQAGGTAGIEVLTRGPVHEAFAETISYDPKPGIIVNAKPPELINEVPPEQK